MPESHEDLEAVRSIVDILGPFDTAERERILRWSSEKAGLMGKLMEKFNGFTGASAGDVMAILFLAFRESIVEQNEVKRYLIKKLQEMNKIDEALADYLEYLSERSQELAESIRESDSEDAKITVELRCIGFETQLVEDISEIDYLDTYCGCVMIQRVTGELSIDQLKHEIENVEKQMETARNKAEKIKSRFKALSEKVNQLNQQLTLVLRTMRDIGRIGLAGSDLGAS
jgi:hypothetical protein